MGACRACCQKTTLQAATYPGSNERSCQIQRLENKGREKHTGNFGKRAKLKNYHPCQPKCQKATSNFHIKQFATKTDFATNSKLTNFQFSSKKTVCPARRRRVWLPSPLSCHKPSPFCLCPQLPGDEHSTPGKWPAEKHRGWFSGRQSPGDSQKVQVVKHVKHVKQHQFSDNLWHDQYNHKAIVTKNHTNLREELQRHRNGTHFQALPRTRWTMVETTAAKTPHPLDQSKWQLEYRWKWHDPTPSNSWCFRRCLSNLEFRTGTSPSRSWSES